MPSPGVVLTGALGLLGALVYVGLARLELRRTRETQQLASGAIALFWLALGIHLAVDSAWGIAGTFGPISPAVSETVLHLKVASGAVAFGGLVYHLVYLYSGRPGLVWLVTIYFLLAFALVEHNYVLRGPIGHEMTPFAAKHAFEQAGGAFEDVAMVLLFLPGIVASLAYLGLGRRVRLDATRRRRHLTRALGLLGFFGSLLVGFLADWSWWEPAERSIALSTGLVALVGARAASASSAEPHGVLA